VVAAGQGPQIAAGRVELDRALALGGCGPYVFQAAIASLHAEMPCDWAQIAALYGELMAPTQRGAPRRIRGFEVPARRRQPARPPNDNDRRAVRALLRVGAAIRCR
jgi:hypothetical protein